MNEKCRHYQRLGTEESCRVGMEMFFCSDRCVYATNGKGTYVTNGYGKIVGIRQEGNAKRPIIRKRKKV